MADLLNHPDVIRHRTNPRTAPDRVIRAERLRSLCLDSGADDVGFVGIDRAELDDQRAELLRLYPWTKTLISIVCKMNREPIRSPARSVANLEFHHTGDRVDEAASRIVRALEAEGRRALNPPMGFPMEMSRSPDKIWVVSHKPVAVAAGLGSMGIHRNVIHPRFGNFILLGTILTDAEIAGESESRPLDYNPCLECKLCVAACPVGAIGGDGSFNLSSCFTHNYREFHGGFADWVKTAVESRDARDYGKRVTDQETFSLWQSLGFGPNYKAAYCLAVCPAGEDVIGPYLQNKKEFIQEIVEPLRSKEETLYVVANSDAEAYAKKKFPNKRTKRVGNGIRPSSVRSFLTAIPRVFQPNASSGLAATYHFTFEGAEEIQATIVIRDKSVRVEEGHVGSADLSVHADSATWAGFVRKERSLVWALLRRKIRLKGSPRLLLAFGKCFPS